MSTPSYSRALACREMIFMGKFLAGGKDVANGTDGANVRKSCEALRDLADRYAEVRYQRRDKVNRIARTIVIA